MMRAQATDFNQLIQTYSHPSIAFFRAIELAVLYEFCQGKEFGGQSLDLGCGDGRIAQMLFDQRFEYGLDNGEAEDVNAAIKNQRYGKVLIEDARKISLENNSLDFIFSNCVIEHIPQVEKVLQEVSRILKPGGVFIFTVPSHLFGDYLYLTNLFSGYGLMKLADYYSGKRNQMLNHFNILTVEQWGSQLEQVGMAITGHQYYMSREALMLWDRMALEIFLLKRINPKAETKVKKRYCQKMQELYNQEKSGLPAGGALIIQAQKPALNS